jgi:DNA sulfur modification protein DndD
MVTGQRRDSMKIKKARFENFRLLREVEINFSIDPNRRLTVIRAENETGKTTLLLALQWALFGNDGLNRRDLRLHPIYWSLDDGPVEIAAELEFEHTYERKSRSGETIRSQKTYLIRRTQTDQVGPGNEWKTLSNSLSLNEITETGFAQVPAPQIAIEQMLTSGVKDLFFTDGDRALSFISSEITDSEKRSLVQRAIRDMLGFEVLEPAIDHVKAVRRVMRQAVAQEAGDQDLQGIENDLSGIEDRIDEAERQLAEVDADQLNLSGHITSLQEKINQVLEKGNREQLAATRREAEIQRQAERKRLAVAEANHSELFRRNSESLALALLATKLETADRLIKAQTSTGRIPRTSIAVLRGRLEMGECICGQKLAPGSLSYENIQALIKREESTSEVDARLTHLGYSAGTFLAKASSDAHGWVERYAAVADERDAADRRLKDLGTQLAEIDKQIALVPDSDLPGLQETLAAYTIQRNEKVREHGILTERMSSLQRERRKLEAEQQRVSRLNNRAHRLKMDQQAADDVLEVLQKSYAAIQQHAIPVIGSEMNRLFLKMINSDPEQLSIIREAALSPSYRIEVYGPEDRALNPDQDLNGASRRALTLAFILALTRTSGVDSALVIDTPLGMMSGAVKRSVTETLIEEASQPVLLLTRSEITDIEDILDTATGRFNTLTNSAHYPMMVVNEGPARCVMACRCTHREFCDVCERVGDREAGVLVHRAG